VKVLSCCGHGWAHRHSHAEAAEDSLREEELPEFFAEGGHHYGEDIDHCWGPDDLTTESIEERTTKECTAEEEEDLDRSDPGNC